jgi:hypothetical protein
MIEKTRERLIEAILMSMFALEMMLCGIVMTLLALK